MTRKTLALLLALMLLVLTACASPSATPSEAPQSTKSAAPAETAATEAPAETAAALSLYEITYYMWSLKASDQDEIVEKAINELIAPKFNATINFVMITDGDWDTKALVPLRAGEKIDIFYTPEWKGFMTNIANGSLLKLNDPSGPYGNLVEPYAQTIADEGAFITANLVDGDLYTLSTIKELCVPGGLIWNQEYVEKYNIDIASVDTYAEMDPYLEMYKKDNPGNYPVLATTGWSFISPFIQGFLNSVDPISIRIGEKGATNGEPELVWESPEALEHVKWMGEWAGKGYVNPDAQLKTYSMTDSLNAGQFLVYYNQLKGGQVKAKEIMSSSGNPDLRLIEQQTSASVIVTTHLGGSMYGIPITSADPQRAMMYLNEMYQNPELINLMAWGVEGVHYTLDDQGRAIQTPMNGWSDSHGGKWTIGNQFKQYVSNQEDVDKYQQMQALTDEAWNHESLGFRFKQDDYASEYSATYNVTDSMLRGVMSGVNAAGLQEMIDGYKAAGVNDVIFPAVKEAYAKWKENQKAINPNYPANPS
ncbi:MAG: ABC transporter substrate-binding protein [Christensenellaceae bacterium]|jgi:putative aldouronate transport system substrate-binding protein|nr:ABC transporter substrate-binding protein [Christensenellaceae bacterium]